MKLSEAAELDALNRSVVVTSVSAWELMSRNWPARPFWRCSHRRAALSVHGQCITLRSWDMRDDFHTPDPKNVKTILSDAVGLADVRLGWVWTGSTSAQAAQEFLNVMELRHKIAHGKHPRPLVSHNYANLLPDFFRQLAQATDQTARDHLVNVLGVATPWPP